MTTAMSGLLVAMLVAASVPVTADARERGVNERQHNQHQRIVQGVRSGELTRHEAGRLMAGQREIRAEERQYRSDGVLTREERADLYQDLYAAGRHIYNETHDAQTRR